MAQLDQEMRRLEIDLVNLETELRFLESRLVLRQVTRDLHRENGLFEEEVGGIPRPMSGGSGSEANTRGRDGEPMAPTEMRRIDASSLYQGMSQDAQIREEAISDDGMESYQSWSWAEYFGGSGSQEEPASCEPTTDEPDNGERSGMTTDQPSNSPTGSVFDDMDQQHDDLAPGGAIGPGPDGSGDSTLTGVMEIVSPDVLSIPSNILPGGSARPGEENGGGATARSAQDDHTSESLADRIRRLREQQRRARRNLEALEHQRRELVEASDSQED